MNQTVAVGLAAMLFVAAPCVAGCQNPLQVAHIEANAPADGEFLRLLERDLQAYFVGTGMADPRISYEFLRDGPTQSGVSYPKYYRWVAITSAGEASSGAIRVAAIDGTRFEITDYVPQDDIRANPEILNTMFPQALVPSILTKAAQP